MPINETFAVDPVTALKAKEIKFQLPTLDVLVVGKWVWVSGATYPARTQLIAMGLHWSKDKSKWYWKPAGHNFRGRRQVPFDTITEKYGQLRVTGTPQMRGSHTPQLGA